MLLFLVPKGNPELLELLSLHWIIDIFRTTIVSDDDDKDDDDDDDNNFKQSLNADDSDLKRFCR